MVFPLIFFLVIQNEREVNSLEQGQTAELHVTLQTDADAEYVMIEVAIPAGCSYADRNQPWRGLEDHREYRREKVVIYCSALSIGTHTFFILNPARAEQMYFPVLYGSNEVKRLSIE